MSYSHSLIRNKHTSLLVTGSHRSGTTWVGTMLAASGAYAYVSEPLNIFHRQGVLRAPVEYWYNYICEDNEDHFLSAFQDTLRLRYHTLAELPTLHTPKDIGRMLRDWGRFARGRLGHRQALLRDPFAVFSAPWFADVLGCRVVITVRHPAAFVGSVKRLGWTFDFQNLLNQPLLMRDWLEPFRAEMEQAKAQPNEIIFSASLLWRLIYHAVLEYRHLGLPFEIVRHEDLSLNPVGQFKTLFQQVGVPFTPRLQAVIQKFSGEQNPSELRKRDMHAVRLNSRANLKNWHKRLTEDEIERIRQLTADVSDHFYTPHEDWE